jgi:hypothetical protein
VDKIGCDTQIVKNEVGRPTVVGNNAADSGRSHEHVLWPGFREEPLDGALVCQVKVGMASKDQISIPGGMEPPDQGRTH